VALVRERVKVAASRFQETRVYKTRDHVENPLPGVRIVSASVKERVQIERLAAHLAEYFNTLSVNASISDDLLPAS